MAKLIYIEFQPHKEQLELRIHCWGVRDSRNKFLLTTKMLPIEHRGMWGGAKVWMTGNDEYCLAVNERLRAIRSGLEAVCMRLSAKGKPDAREVLQEYFKTVDLPKCSFSKLMDEYVMAKELSENTRKVYRTSIATHSQAFFAQSFGSPDVELGTIDLPSLYRFELYLKAKSLKSGTIKEYVGKLKAMFEHAVRVGYLKTNPYENYQSGTVKSGQEKQLVSVIQRVISQRDLEHIETVEPPLESAFTIARPGFHRTRLLFLFQSWTGMSFIDMINYNLNDLIIKDFSGVESIMYNRIKTGALAMVPIHKELLSIIQKLNHDIHPGTPDSTYRDRVNSMLEFYGCRYDGSGTHTGRHVFGERMMFMGYSIEAISRMMGHKNIQQTQSVYAKIDNSKIMAEYQKINNASQETKLNLTA